MRRIFNGFATLGVLALASVLMLSSPAQAAFKLELLDSACSGTGIGGAANACNVYITDNVALASDGNTGDTSGTIAGLITQSNGLVGSNFTVTSTTDQSKPIVGPGELSSSAFTVSAAGGGTLIIALTDTNFNNPGAGSYTLKSQMSLTSLTGLTSYKAFGAESNTNGEFALTNQTTTGTLTTAATGTMTFGGPFAITTPYSLTEVMTVTFGSGGGNANFTSDLSLLAPEPASVALLGAALLFVCGGLRRKLRQN